MPRCAARCGAFIGSFRQVVEGAPTYESTWTPTKWRRRQARVADEARDIAGTPRLLLGRAVARDEVDDRTALHAAATTPDLSSTARCPRAVHPPAARLSMPKTRRLTPARPPPERLAARARRMPGPATRPQSAPLPRSRARVCPAASSA